MPLIGVSAQGSASHFSRSDLVTGRPSMRSICVVAFPWKVNMDGWDRARQTAATENYGKLPDATEVSLVLTHCALPGTCAFNFLGFGKWIEASVVWVVQRLVHINKCRINPNWCKICDRRYQKHPKTIRKPWKVKTLGLHVVVPGHVASDPSKDCREDPWIGAQVGSGGFRLSHSQWFRSGKMS